MPTLGSLKLIGYCALGLLVAGLILALSLERRHSAKLQAQVVSLNATLVSISEAKATQKAETVKNIVIADKGQKQAEVIAKRIETAPLSLNCETPAAIMGSSDL